MVRKLYFHVSEERDEEMAEDGYIIYISTKPTNGGKSLDDSGFSDDEYELIEGLGLSEEMECIFTETAYTDIVDGDRDDLRAYLMGAGFIED